MIGWVTEVKNCKSGLIKVDVPAQVVTDIKQSAQVSLATVARVVG